MMDLRTLRREDSDRNESDNISESLRNYRGRTHLISLKLCNEDKVLRSQNSSGRHFFDKCVHFWQELSTVYTSLLILPTGALKQCHYIGNQHQTLVVGSIKRVPNQLLI